MRHWFKAAVLILLVSEPAVAQMTEQQLLTTARSIARTLNLSPAGTELWARQSVKRAANDEYDEATKVEIEIGRELARSSPDRGRLNELVEQYAKQVAAVERERKGKELDDAFQLSTTDRQKVGLFIENAARESLKRRGPNLKPLP